MRDTVKFIHAALDEDPKGGIILRGVISPESLYLIKVGAYQREVLPTTKASTLVAAFDEDKSVPDVDLGMRGGSFIEKEGAFYMQDDVFVIDGLQRITAAKKCLESGKDPRLGATVHFNTDERFERERFKILNTTNTKLSPNVLLRNMQKDYMGLDLLNVISKDKSFVLYEKISWNQRMTREELITALTLLRVSSVLHQRFGSATTTRFQELADRLEKTYNKLGRSTIRDNIKTFWNVIDECFNIRFVTFKDGAVYLRAGFLTTMARVFSDHNDFWKDSKFFVPKPLIRKIALFPINDPEVIRLCGAGGAARELLYQLMINHINSGKRTGRLTAAKVKQALTKTEKIEEEEEQEGTEVYA